VVGLSGGGKADGISVLCVSARITAQRINYFCGEFSLFVFFVFFVVKIPLLTPCLRLRRFFALYYPMRPTFSRVLLAVLVFTPFASLHATDAPAPPQAVPWTLTAPGLITFLAVFIILKVVVKMIFRRKK
jgi:hypothetical protein